MSKKIAEKLLFFRSVSKIDEKDKLLQKNEFFSKCSSQLAEESFDNSAEKFEEKSMFFRSVSKIDGKISDSFQNE